MKNLEGRQGQSLIQVMVSVAIMGILMSVFMTMMKDHSRSTQALTEKFAALDLQQLMTTSLADGAVCKYVLNNPTVLTFDSTLLTPSTPQIITLPDPDSAGNRPRLYTSMLPSAPSMPGPVIAEVSLPASPLANTLVVKSIQLKITSGSGTSYAGHWQVHFDPEKTIRPVKPVSVAVKLDADITVPASAKIVGCQKQGDAAGTVCGQRSLICMGTTPVYDNYNSDIQECHGATLTANCNRQIPANAGQWSPDAVDGCPTGYAGKFVSTGVYFFGGAYQIHYILYCSKI